LLLNQPPGRWNKSPAPKSRGCQVLARFVPVLSYCCCLPAMVQVRKAGLRRLAQPSSGTLPAIEVLRRRSLAGIDVDKVPASVTTVGSGEIQRTRSLNITDALQWVPGISSTKLQAIHSSPTCSFPASSHLQWRAPRKGLRFIKTGALQRGVRRCRALGCPPMRRGELAVGWIDLTSMPRSVRTKPCARSAG